MDVVDLTKRLISIKSESQHSNVAISDYLQSILSDLGLNVERLSYQDQKGEEKVCLVARIGPGQGGLGFFAHSDTVPGIPGDWQPYTPQVDGSRLIGRGSCDMKGPLAAVLAAASRLPLTELRSPLFIVIASDEEVNFAGAYHLASKSKTLASGWPSSGVITEPTRMRPVHAHKGVVRIEVVAKGVAAHTSTDVGVSANFLIAPFLAEMAELAGLLSTDQRYMNDEFDPPTNGFNMILNDGGCASNVTAAQTVCTLSLRPMPADNHEELIQKIRDSAHKHGLEFTVMELPAMRTDPNSEIVKAAMESTGTSRSETAPYGTDGAVYTDYTDLVVLGPGSIEQAHTVGEWIDIDALGEAIDVYLRLMRRFCL
jgi:acetylornithine deacetylase